MPGREEAPIVPETPPVPHAAQSLDGQLCFAVYAAAHAFGRAYRAKASAAA